MKEILTSIDVLNGFEELDLGIKEPPVVALYAVHPPIEYEEK